MLKAPIPENEIERLRKLWEYKILDSVAESNYNQIVDLAASVCGTRIALISLVDSHRQWFKAKHGLDASETPRDISFCGHAIMGDDLFFNSRLC